MSIWNDSPRLNSPPQTNEVGVVLEYVKGLANTVAKMAKDLEFILNGNVAFDNIRAEGIETKNLKAESITTSKIQAGAVTADKITVEQLSAISANLGHIIAGLIESVQIFGSYIATSYGSYPLVELSNTNNMLGAWKNWNNAVQIYSPSDMFSPIIRFMTPVGVAYILYDTEENAIAISSNDANIHINTTEEVNILGRKGVWINGQQVAGPI